MPRETRLQNTPATLPGRAHLPLLRSMAVAVSRMLPEGLTFTVLTQDSAGQVVDYVTNSPKPVKFRKPKTRAGRKR